MFRKEIRPLNIRNSHYWRLHVHCYMREVINYQQTAVSRTKTQFFFFILFENETVGVQFHSHARPTQDKGSQFCSIIQCIRRRRM